jgi:plastocyanin
MAVVLVATIGGCAPEAEARVTEIVVPAGTQARLERGETVVVMPAELRLRVGDTLRIRNEDAVEQAVGPFVVAAGEVFELRYGAPGEYEGYCPLSEGETYRIVVTP